MAFPVVQATNTYSASSGTNHAVNLPSGIVSGDFLIVIFGNDTLAGGDTPSAPSGWTRLYNNSTSFECSLFYRTADGTEGATQTFVTNSTEAARALSLRISGVDTSTTIEHTLASFADAQPNPPNLNCTFSGDILYLAIMYFEQNGAATTVNSYPSMYSGGLLAGGPAIGWSAYAWKESTLSSEDPGPFTMNRADNWRAVTLGILGLPTGGEGNFLSFM